MEEFLGIKKSREEMLSKKKGEKKKQETRNEKRRKQSSPLEEAKTKRRAGGERKEEEEKEIFNSANVYEMEGSSKEMMDEINKLLEDSVEQKQYRKKTREKLANIENKLFEEKREILESVKLLNKRIDNLESKMKEENDAREKREAEDRVRKVILGDTEGLGQKLGRLERKLGCLEEGAINSSDKHGKGERKGKEENNINEEIKWLVEMSEREKRKRNIIIKGLKPEVSGDTKMLEKCCARKLGVELKAKKS